MPSFAPQCGQRFNLRCAAGGEIAGGHNYPGGVGQSLSLYQLADRLLRDTAELLKRCPRDDGCPACVVAGGRSRRAREAGGRTVPGGVDGGVNGQSRRTCLYNQEMPEFDVVGVGLNATDTL